MNHLTSHSDVTTLEAMVAGGSAGLLSRFFIAPLDLVKIRMQLHAGSDGIFKTVVGIAKNEGIRAFWKGNLPAEILYLLFSSSQFMTLRATNVALEKFPLTNKLPEGAKQFISGGVAGSFSTFTTYPFDFLRTRAAANRSKVAPMLSTIRKIYGKEGIKGFYHGCASAVVPIFPHMGVFFACYSFAREVMGQERKRLPSWFPEIFSAASFAAVVSKAAMFPFDTIRKRIQVHGMSTLSETTAHGHGRQYSHNFLSCGKEIISRDGFRGLYRGLMVSLVKSVPSSILTIYFYELSIVTLRKLKGRRETE